MFGKNKWQRLAETLDVIEAVINPAAKYEVDRWLRTQTEAQVGTIADRLSIGWRGIGRRTADMTQRRDRARAMVLLAHVRGQVARVNEFKGLRNTRTVAQLDGDIQQYYGGYVVPVNNDPDETLPAAAGQTWEQRLQQDGLNLLAHVSVSPPHDGQILVANVQNDFTNRTAGGVQHTEFGAFVDPTMRTITPRNNAFGNSFTIYWLPWKDRHIVDFQLAAGVGTPQFFFTSAIGGCSVFVQGPGNTPTTYHAGIDGTVSQHYNQPNAVNPQIQALHQAAQADNAPLFWHLLVEHVYGVVVAAPGWGEVDKRDYIKDGNTMFGTDCTARVVSFVDRVQGMHKAEGLRVSDIRPSGCVFGIQNGGNWEFYLQENIAITYQLREMPNRPRRRASLPFEVHKIWPVPAARRSIVPKYCRMPWLLAVGERVVAA